MTTYNFYHIFCFRVESTTKVGIKGRKKSLDGTFLETPLFSVRYLKAVYFSIFLGCSGASKARANEVVPNLRFVTFTNVITC